MLNDNGGAMYMPVAPAYGGNGFGMGGDWAWVILLLLAFGGGWGMGGFGGGFGADGIYPWLNNSQNINDGFRDQMLNTTVSSIGDKIASGFGDVQTALCGGFAGVNATVNNGVNTLAQQMYNGTIADMERSFALQSQLAQCCCDNRLATAQTQALVQSENCADRAVLSDGIRDILTATQLQTQTILDKMCQDKIDAKNEKIVELNNKINSLEANNYIQNALTAQTRYIVGLYPPPAAATTIVA